MVDKQSKNENREKLTVLLDKDIKLKIKKEVLDLECSIGEFIEKLYTDYESKRK